MKLSKTLIGIFLLIVSFGLCLALESSFYLLILPIALITIIAGALDDHYENEPKN